jgi:hypothetical protein
MKYLTRDLKEVREGDHAIVYATESRSVTLLEGSVIDGCVLGHNVAECYRSKTAAVLFAIACIHGDIKRLLARQTDLLSEIG